MKDVIDSVKNLDNRWVINYVGLFFSTIAPGMLIIYLYKPVMFVQLETIKLILFSLSLSLPLWLVNMFILGPPGKREQLDSFIKLAFFCSISAGFGYYSGLLISYIFTLQFLWFVLLSILFNASLLWRITVIHKKPNKSSNLTGEKDSPSS